MSNAMILHFSLGPVQGFIGQARRTRDYWAGSFLLSYLAGCAMHALQESGYGNVEFPVVGDDPLYRAIREARANDASSSDVHIGSLPNRFKARITKPEAFGPRGEDPCSRAVRMAWARIAEEVWQQFLNEAAAGGHGTRAIWDRQVGEFKDDGSLAAGSVGFFEITWVLSDDPGDGSDGAWLDRRKNWRSHPRRVECGDHCRMISELQELSGYVRARGPSVRQKQERFWNHVRGRVAQVIDERGPRRDVDRAEYELLELPRTERLCAIALIKRLFPILPESKLRAAIGWVPDGPQRVRSGGRQDPLGRIRYWPSTAYMAAVPWAKRAWQLDSAACAAFAKACRDKVYVEAVAERASRVSSLSGESELPADQDALQAFGGLDGGLFFEDMLETDRRNAEREHDTAEEENVRRRAELEVKRKEAGLAALRQFSARLEETRKRRALAEPTFRQAKFVEASPFYALLLMDGDKTGALLGKLEERDVSRALSDFTQDVQKIVRDHDGVLIYAGGDDVKAFLPLTQAVDCASRLHEVYLKAFADCRGSEKPTISAGLVFAHHNVPLSSVIREAHEQLDKVAKDGNGRNSLAIAVLKPSGKAMAWVSAFARQQGHVRALGPIDRLMPLAKAYAREEERSTSFLYNLAERYGDLLEKRPDKRTELLLAEWTKGRSYRGDRKKSAQRKLAEERARVRQLLRACETLRGDGTAGAFRLDGGLIARFLADNGVGVDQPPRGREPSEAAA